MLTTIHSDAASKGNPGPSTAGVTIVRAGHQYQYQHALGNLSNHEAEFAAAQFAFEQADRLCQPDDTIMFYSDANLVIASLEKRYAKHFPKQLTSLLAHIDRYQLVIVHWIPEKENKGAHHLAQQALHRLLASS
ncbi:RNase H family protein [Weissella halotolerans]|uniref:Ribonuclease h n=1 Tax=Weissella halotolerans DSM 20190 TaxID=1123500 RepID=A0A0R2FYJ6_9LACO|nr:RNase H family protein [Weissella halotolerans]KRN33248.1 ribonuclease h [Weissella halotolerans DSM 20190]